MSTLDPELQSQDNEGPQDQTISVPIQKKRKRKPARKQVESRKYGHEHVPVAGTVWNIWYGRWSGGDRDDEYMNQNHSDTRCDIAKDSGWTRADKIVGSYFCLFFARGNCPQGHECNYLHRLPTVHDIFNPNVDCFGREKHSDYRDDMGGVGSFMRQNTTLYVGRINVSDDIEEIVSRHFAEWGEVERIRVLNSRGIAFVTYALESNAQFAKEAMAHQSLDHNEILNVRWASHDPNPLTVARDKRRVEEQAAEAIRKALPAEFVAEIEGRDPELAKRRRIEGSFGLPGYEAPDDIWYARGQGAINPAVRTKELEGPRLVIEESDNREQGLLPASTLKFLSSLKSSYGMGSLVAYQSDESE
ncbi:Pre-mRNA-splicing factor cwc2 [Neolecta irregularis DAH-3]|uniref:Pre-mRNA-splicing factor cwc2 n=1 Tax=Neolecta irregularis (strain DAH-3) TaxID=1198029 RepID=A0A1U7LW52_NEOID|nr:Pre-mRNA-splicing factor cwc2 [Neolecta irregularis DAH-3]|eukprot:OLL26910.1 Pre-mRNA-splicing factor cwc2 [Neolecta irregularis DAH-3]